ncbi:DUF4442 domain-containing protein [Kibdelosporangium philippinense]|uniref:DUF4442 domain-containing protein n=1 Tax=Kibdelosporangium philippinense TaxID=211113 RepID=A0ABS8ZNB5_9PSEU|nr:DUF4442 domain-containing protein [Kibdelosporangium philippinense]MCE7009255.1 DUF4442 domain-containing protein [Kibdelosporangium philippinense]
MDLSMLGDAMKATVPWVRTAGIEFKEVASDRVVTVLPDNPVNHNHVGGAHAAVAFGLAETASGAVVMASFSDQLARATPLVKRSEIDYKKVAMGDLTAEAVLGRAPEEIVAELDNGTRPEFPVHVTIRNAEDVTTAEVTVTWTLRPNR